jgi:putative hydroxymethylpyrimidine transport system substrate-binding protein
MGVLRIGLEWFKNPDHVPFFIADELGWLAEVGLETILTVPDIHMDAMQVFFLTFSSASVEMH